MKKNYKTGPHLFFIEFLIVLFFFLIISTVCLRIFVQAHNITRNANALSWASSYAASVAEILEGSDGSAPALQAAYPDAEFSFGEDTFTMVLSFNSDFEPCLPADSSYLLTAVLSSSRWQTTGSIRIIKNEMDKTSAQDSGKVLTDDSVIYELSVSFHRPFTREEALS